MNIENYQSKSLPYGLVACAQVAVAQEQCTSFRIVAKPVAAGTQIEVDVLQALFTSIAIEFSQVQGGCDALMMSGAINRDNVITVTGTVLRELSRHGVVVRAIKSALVEFEAKQGAKATVKAWPTRGVANDDRLSEFVDRLDCGPLAQTYCNEAAMSFLEDLPEGIEDIVETPTIH